MCKSYLVGSIFQVYNPLHKRAFRNLPIVQHVTHHRLMTQKQIVLLQSLAAMPSTIRHMLQEREGEQPPLQETSIPTILRDLITYEKNTLSQMKHIIAEEIPRLHSRHDIDPSATAEMTRDDLLDKFEGLRKETLSFLTQRLPQDWDRTARGPSGESLSLRQHTINLTEHDRNALNQLKIDLRIRR